jgi:hypothetical protein
MPYELTEHRHRFAAWAAARGSQRNFTSVDKLRDALESCGVREFVSADPRCTMDDDSFRTLHREWCRAIVSHLSRAGVAKATFGRAAKLVGIYLKVMIVIGPAGDCDLARVAYPPIDAIILENVSRARELDSPHKRDWSKARWTQLTEDGYYVLVDQLRAVLGPTEPFWALERFWNANDESET